LYVTSRVAVISIGDRDSVTTLDTSCVTGRSFEVTVRQVSESQDLFDQDRVLSVLQKETLSAQSIFCRRNAFLYEEFFEIQVCTSTFFLRANPYFAPDV
jgi:hypothetical protein